MREIKFRAFDGKQWSYFTIGQTMTARMQAVYDDHCLNGRQFFQYTGLKDKNGLGDICFYEGDIVNLEGELIGNKYEQANLLEGKTNLLIEGMGTDTWRNTEQEAIKRGLGYAK